MTMITLEHDITRQQEMLEASREEVSRLLNEVKSLRAQLERGQAPDAASCPDVKRLTGLVKNCLEVETSLVKCKEQQAGIAQCGVAFDLEAARDSIGCKLDKLRGS
ncbi:hypothetical protein E4Z66_01655 [Aliishimia ponticola]|uniref:Uncharacterized protein n=1 Tax=Aliishimia ponticola TaxID=2499833 RepID=A0A4S4NFE3_9RHOB|nr:hypothetical protein [Aliishimia ponticola]THH38302.1 hypothetical protein E4Z66_01655 [Aliishimia ponticola]